MRCLKSVGLLRFFFCASKLHFVFKEHFRHSLQRTVIVYQMFHLAHLLKVFIAVKLPLLGQQKIV